MEENNVVSLSGASPPESDPAELNLRLLECLGRYLLRRRGPDALRRATRAAGLEPAHLDGKTRWIAATRFQALLEAAREELESDDEFFEANLYEYAQTQGLIRYLVPLTSPVPAYERGCQMFRSLASRISEMTPTRLGNRKLRLVYTSTRDESRLMCLSRMASLAVTPTLWGLPRAHVVSTKCLAEGDECCEYELTVYESSRWMPALIGAGAGAAVAFALAQLNIDPAYLMWLPPIAGGLLGHTLELRRVNRHNIATGERAQELMRELAEDDAEARREIMELHGRQNEWLELMEEQLAERSAALSEVVQRIRGLSRTTHSTIQGLSHDLRNPLHVLLMEAEVLAAHRDVIGDDMVEEHVHAVRRIQQLLGELMQFVTTERVSMELAPEPVEIGGLTERLRRQLRALVHGKPIRPSVFKVREAPDRIVVDPMVLDRIIDNLFTNAAKYTESGSIVVEVGGTPGFLTLKVSDTGRGIEPERLETAFTSGATSAADRASGSYGIGLSVVVDLLRRIGGRLEVMSKPQVGTTFWVHVPVEPSEHGTNDDRRDAKGAQVLTIRKVNP
jgi:signal transduction histidine kinase